MLRYEMSMGTAFVLPAVRIVFVRIRGALTFGFEQYRFQPRDAADLPR